MGTYVVLLSALLAMPVAAAVQPAPVTASPATVVIAVEAHRDGARLVGFTVKPRAPLAQGNLPPVSPYGRDSRTTQLEIVLTTASGGRHVRRIDAGPLCLTHGANSEPHVRGDTIRVHRDVVLAEFPHSPDLERIEVALHEWDHGELARTVLGTDRFDDARRDPGGIRPAVPARLAASLDPEAAAAPDTTGAVFWPEDFDDPDVYRVWGDESEIDRRINIVIVPDGYRYADKSLMEGHAQSLVDRLGFTKPYHQHEPFLNYILVYAYSTQNWTDECDCGTVADTAMGTYFPDFGYPCRDSGNRCLYYGTGCDVDSTANIMAAEMRAPARDETFVMVNTSRYGGCGGYRAVFAAAHSDGNEIAAHEMAHVLPGLADEYGGPGCGAVASEINTSTDPVNGAWPEWISSLGAPREGGEYYDQCIYRPWSQCAMRSIGPAFCWVCNQHYSLTIFGHPRVQPTAPVESSAPVSPVTVEARVAVDFGVATRLGIDTANDLTWTIEGPGYPEPTVVATQTGTYTHAFDPAGDYVLTCEVVANSDMIKPEKNGANVDVVIWDIHATAPRPTEVSGPGSAEPLHFTGPSDLSWENAASSGATAFNLYRGDRDGVAAGDMGACLQQGLGSNSTSDTESPPVATCWTYLVSGSNEVGEGTLGSDTSGAQRSNLHPCGGAP